jgi:hypothetical protein
LAWLAGVVLFVQTDQGTFEVVSGDEDIKISVEKGRREIAILDPKKKMTYRLATGAYQIKLLGEGKDLEVSPRSAVLKRGDKVILTVRSLGKAPAVAPPEKWPPLDRTWLEKSAKLPRKEKAEAIIAELKRRNPGFEAVRREVRLAEEGKLALSFLAARTCST